MTPSTTSRSVPPVFRNTARPASVPPVNRGDGDGAHFPDASDPGSPPFDPAATRPSRESSLTTRRFAALENVHQLVAPPTPTCRRPAAAACRARPSRFHRRTGGGLTGCPRGRPPGAGRPPRRRRGPSRRVDRAQRGTSPRRPPSPPASSSTSAARPLWARRCPTRPRQTFRGSDPRWRTASSSPAPPRAAGRRSARSWCCGRTRRPPLRRAASRISFLSVMICHRGVVCP